MALFSRNETIIFFNSTALRRRINSVYTAVRLDLGGVIRINLPFHCFQAIKLKISRATR